MVEELIGYCVSVIHSDAAKAAPVAFAGAPA